MNVFEDLITELKQSNLLESTVVETERSEAAGINVTMDFAIADHAAARSEDVNELTASDQNSTEASRESEKSGKEFYKKRAVSEVSSLQMVEHVLTGVEREHMKIVPKSFDDLNAKKALHTFLNADASSQDHSDAEFALLQETEAWCTALGERDGSIPVSSLRLYCENSRPALSSQAMVGLARFYRNLPYSEQRRSKFDFIMTRLFSRPSGEETRTPLFERDEMFNHISTLYREWSSIPLYTAEEDDSKVLLTALSFEDLANEAEQASTFDQLITSDFFSRLRLFKESISELFFAPNVTAAAIECNIRIGNAYVKLIHLEREKMDEESIASKYGDINDQAVSDAAARTLQLVELLRGRPIDDVSVAEPEEPDVPNEMEVAPRPISSKQKKSSVTEEEHSPFIRRLRDNAMSINKWFLAGALLLIAASVGIWVWANYVVEEHVSSAGVQTVVLDSVMSEHISTARISSGMFYGLLSPSWELLTKEKREEFVKKVLEAGRSKGFEQVTLLGKEGKVAAYANATRIDVNMP